jgi:hypothetical protein
MRWYEWLIAIAVVWTVLLCGTLYATSKSVWEAGNSCYIPEGK